VIVTIYAGSSYDNIFREIAQKAPEGRVVLYELNPGCAGPFLDILLKRESKSDKFQADQKFKENVDSLIAAMMDVEPESVLFNWECCSEFGDHKWPYNND